MAATSRESRRATGAGCAGSGCGRRPFRRRRHFRQRSDKPIPAAGESLDKPRRIRRITQSCPEPLDGCIEAVLEIYERVGLPKPLLQFLARNDLARMLHQQCQNVNGLALKLDPEAMLAQFA